MWHIWVNKFRDNSFYIGKCIDIHYNLYMWLKAGDKELKKNLLDPTFVWINIGQ